MKTLHYSGQFKKDFKRYGHQPKKLAKLVKILHLLRLGEELPSSLCAHKLDGRYKDCTECHVGGDFLLIWTDETDQLIRLVRLGSHSELFPG